MLFEIVLKKHRPFIKLSLIEHLNNQALFSEHGVSASYGLIRFSLLNFGFPSIFEILQMIFLLNLIS